MKKDKTFQKEGKTVKESNIKIAKTIVRLFTAASFFAFYSLSSFFADTNPHAKRRKIDRNCFLRLPDRRIIFVAHP